MNKKTFPKQALKQKRFHEHYSSDINSNIEDLIFGNIIRFGILIDKEDIKRIKEGRVVLDF